MCKKLLFLLVLICAVTSAQQTNNPKQTLNQVNQTSLIPNPGQQNPKEEYFAYSSGMNIQTNNDEEADILSVVNSWIQATMDKSSDIGDFYTKYLEFYYTFGTTTRQKVVNDKVKFFNKWDTIDLSISNVNILDKGLIENVGYVYEVIYNKNFEVENLTSQRSMTGEVKSELELVSDHGGYLICGEKDLRTIHLKKLSGRQSDNYKPEAPTETEPTDANYQYNKGRAAAEVLLRYIKTHPNSQEAADQKRVVELAKELQQRLKEGK